MELESPKSLVKKYWKDLLGVLAGAVGTALVVKYPELGGPLLAGSGMLLGVGYTMPAAIKLVAKIVTDWLDGPDKPNAAR